MILNTVGAQTGIARSGTNDAYTVKIRRAKHKMMFEERKQVSELCTMY